LKIVKKW